MLICIEFIAGRIDWNTPGQSSCEYYLNTKKGKIVGKETYQTHSDRFLSVGQEERTRVECVFPTS
jgi:hypothetical protein